MTCRAGILGRLGFVASFALLFTFLLGACADENPPEAGLVASVTSGDAPLSVSFTNSSKNANEFPWDFGDGISLNTSSAGEPVTHVYTKAGTHTVTLIAIKRGDPQETSTATVKIVVESGPLDHVIIEPAAPAVGVTREQQFITTALDQFDNPIPGLSYIFRSDEVAGQADATGRFVAGTRGGVYGSGVTVEVTQGGLTRTATARVTIEPGPLHRVKIEPVEPTVEVIKAQRLTATALDQFDNTIPGLIYAFRSDASVGRVDGRGRFVAGTKVGAYENAVTVEVTQGSVTRAATVNVIIGPGPLDHVIIEPAAPVVEVTEEQQLTATALDQFDNPVPGLNYTFQSDREAGRVDTEGRFTAGTRAGTYEGAVTVEVAQGSVTRMATSEVIIEPGLLDHVMIEPNAPSVEATKEEQFTARALDRYDNPIHGLSYIFRSDERAGQMGSEGKFMAGIRAGTYENAVEVAVAQGSVTRTATTKVTIEPGPLDHVVMGPTAAGVEVTRGRRFTPTAVDRFNNPISGLSYIFRSDERAGQVDNEGRFSAGTKAGSYGDGVTVEVTQGTVTAEGTARVLVTHGPLDRVLLTPGAVTLNIGQNQEFSAEAVDAYGNSIPEAQITWLAARGVGTVTDDGILTARTLAGTFEHGVTGTAVLGSTSTGATALVTVNPNSLYALSILPLDVVAGATQKLEAIATDQYGNRVSDLEITWAMLDGSAGSISTGDAAVPPSKDSSLKYLAAGEVAGSFENAIQARATQGELIRIATGSVSIVPGPLEQVVIDPKPAYIGLELTQQFVVVGADKYGNQVSGLTFTWSVETGGGTIDANGLFTAGTEPCIDKETVMATASQGVVTRASTARITMEPDCIIFVSRRGGVNGDIYLMNTDGTNQTHLATPAFSGSPDWSSDGTKLAFHSREGGNFEIYIANADGTEQTNLTNDLSEDEAPAWSPDGTQIAFQSDRDGNSEIYVMNADGTDKTRLTINSAFDASPAWSPDGSKIAFASTRDGGNWQIYVMNADGSNQTRLTSNSSFDRSPDWSPDGSRIAFESVRDGNWEIYVMNADGTNQTRLTNDALFDNEPNWSPDGRKMAFQSNRDGNLEIYVMDADGSSQTNLTNNPADDLEPDWSPSTAP